MMKKKSGFLNKWVLAILVTLLFSTCQKDEIELPEDVLILNHWIWDGMNYFYLWAPFLPNLDPDKQPDPEEYFYNLLYRDDRESWIEKDYAELAARIDGVESSTGVNAIPVRVYNTNDVVYTVMYVTPGSPGAEAGIARGDLIYAVDGQVLNIENYYSLYHQTTATLEFGTWEGENVVPDGRKITLTAIILNQNPVVHYEVIDYEGYKIGYLVYTQFTTGANNEWLQELNTVFEEFKSQGVSDVVVDLTYNPGGSLVLSSYIASTLGPASAGQNHEVFMRMVWNDDLNEYWKEADLDNNGQPDGEESTQLLVRLNESTLNLDLSRIYFLTTELSASASESLMTGLYPYADVVQIGDTTHGKCYGSITIDDWAVPKRHNWAMQPIVLKVSNAEGYTDYVTGIAPDYYVHEDWFHLVPYGNLNDPLLAKALEEISGVAPAVLKSAEPTSTFDILQVTRKPVPAGFITLPGLGRKHVLF